MLGDKETGLKIYSLGIVTKDKPRNTDIIEVYPVEDLPFLNGKIKDYKETMIGTSVDISGVNKIVNLDMTAVIQAKWITIGHSNRSTSPDVIKNETVLLFRFRETNKFYWTVIFNEPGIRRVETVVYRYGAIPKYGVNLDENNSYTMTYSAHDKFIKLTTSIANGEPVKYIILLDLASGVVTVEDDQQNSIIIESIKGNMTTNIRENITFNTKNFTVNAGTINLNAGSINIRSSTMTMNNNTTIVNGNSATFNVSNFTSTAAVSKLNASSAEKFR